jgi:MoaA/NifB/PqqE/SkfB family radical SAM enzyme
MKETFTKSPKKLKRSAVLPATLLIRRVLVRFYSYSRHSTFKKIYNFFRVRFELLLKKEIVKGYPYILQIEPINICQLKCPSCPTGLGTNPDPKGSMSLNDFERIIDQVKDYLYEVVLFGFGESLLNKEIYDMIRYAAANNIRTVLSSNLCDLKEGDIDKLVTSGLELLVVSLDGITQQTYQKYRVMGNVEEVKENIEAIMRKKREKQTPYPVVQVQYILMDHNHHETQQALEYSLSAEVEEFVVKEVGPRYVPRTGANAPLAEMALRLKNQLKFCTKLWTEAYIGWNGIVRPCCLTFDGSMGNIFSEDFKKIWNNNYYVESRRIFCNENMDPIKLHAPCLNCHLLSPWADPVDAKINVDGLQ